MECREAGPVLCLWRVVCRFTHCAVQVRTWAGFTAPVFPLWFLPAGMTDNLTIGLMVAAFLTLLGIGCAIICGFFVLCSENVPGRLRGL